MSYLRCERVVLSSSQTHSRKLALGPANLCSTGCPGPTQEQTTVALENHSPSPQVLPPPGFPVCSHPKQKLDTIASKYLYSDPTPSFPG